MGNAAEQTRTASVSPVQEESKKTCLRVRIVPDGGMEGGTTVEEVLRVLFTTAQL